MNMRYFFQLEKNAPTPKTSTGQVIRVYCECKLMAVKGILVEIRVRLLQVFRWIVIGIFAVAAYVHEANASLSRSSRCNTQLFVCQIEALWSSKLS